LTKKAITLKVQTAMNDTTNTPLTRPVRIATLLMAAAVMVGGMGCITASLIDSAQRSANDRARKAREAQSQRAERVPPAQAPAQPDPKP
jgi:hypothetical protein